MLNIRLICVGKLKETYYMAAFSEYEKRLLPYCCFETAELPEGRLPLSPSEAQINIGLSRVADYRLSISKMAFPHQLARIILAEQIYRGIMINEGGKYHK